MLARLVSNSDLGDSPASASQWWDYRREPAPGLIPYFKSSVDYLSVMPRPDAVCLLTGVSHEAECESLPSARIRDSRVYDHLLPPDTSLESGWMTFVMIRGKRKGRRSYNLMGYI